MWIPFLPHGAAVAANSMFPIGAAQVTGKTVSAAAGAGLAMSPLLGLAGAILGTGANMILTARANSENKALAEKQYQRQREAIAAQNAYNSPASQVVRLRAAGLSPAMFYNGSSAVAGEQSQIPEYDRPDINAPQLDVNSIKSAFVDLSRLDIDRESQDIKNKFTSQQIVRLNQEISEYSDNHPYELRILREELRQAEINSDITEQNFQQAIKDTSIKEWQVKQMAQAYGINEFQLMRAILMFPKEMLQMDAQRALVYSQTHKNDQDVMQAWATINELIRHNKVSEGQQAYRNVLDYDQFEWQKKMDRFNASVNIRDYDTSVLGTIRNFYNNTMDSMENASLWLSSQFNHIPFL